MFRKISYILLCALLLTSCGKDLGVERTCLRFNVNLDRQILTRASTDGSGTDVNRCILELYCDEELFTREVVEYSGAADFINIPVVSGRSYTALFWADCGEGLEDKYYDTDIAGKGLTCIEIISEGYAGNNDARDAFCAKVDNIEIGQTAGETDMNVTLVRPLAQINIIATDSPVSEEVYPDKVQVSFTAPKGINLMSGELLESRPFDYTATVFTSFESLPSSEGKLAMDYIFAPTAPEEASKIAIGFKTLKAETVLNDCSLQEIPYKRGYRTNVKGSFFGNTGESSSVPDAAKHAANAKNIEIANY